MFKNITVFAVVAIFACISSQAISAGQPGTADTVFNKKFARKLKPLMPYEQLVKMIGTEGVKVGEDGTSSASKTLYHWNGERKSALDARVVAGKVIDATVTTPKNKKLSLGKIEE